MSYFIISQPKKTETYLIIFEKKFSEYFIVIFRNLKMLCQQNYKVYMWNWCPSTLQTFSVNCSTITKVVSGAVEHSITKGNSLNMSNCTKSLKLYQQKFGNVISYLSNWKFLGHYLKLPCYVSHSPFFRWFKFTLKPPYSIMCSKLQLAIWDTSFWTFLVKFGHKGPWDIS